LHSDIPAGLLPVTVPPVVEFVMSAVVPLVTVRLPVMLALLMHHDPPLAVRFPATDPVTLLAQFTVAVAVALFGDGPRSGVVEVTVAVLESTVPGGTVGLTCTVSVNRAEA